MLIIKMEDDKEPIKRTNPHIEEYFMRQEGGKDLIVSKEIFSAQKDNVDLKTELQYREVTLLNILFYNDFILMSKGLNPIYNPFLNQYMRLKISLDRKSRGEYVDINRNNDVTKNLQDLSNIKNITDTKK